MLATLFDFPLEDRRLLTALVGHVHLQQTAPIPMRRSPRFAWPNCARCSAYFTRLWNERVNAPPRPDLISMLAHSPATRNMGPMEYMGNLVLLIVGGNDTTRNSMTGGLLALHQQSRKRWPSCAPTPR